MTSRSPNHFSLLLVVVVVVGRDLHSGENNHYVTHEVCIAMDDKKSRLLLYTNTADRIFQTKSCLK
jgi:hypothetical protein